MRIFMMFGLAALALAAPADASRKPCRGADGRIVPCPKPTPTPQHRCKDASGKFVKCEHGDASR